MKVKEIATAVEQKKKRRQHRSMGSHNAWTERKATANRKRGKQVLLDGMYIRDPFEVGHAQ